MGELIDRDELKKRYITTAQSGGYLGNAMYIAINHLTRLLRLIDEAPAVEVKMGEWIPCTNIDGKDLMERGYKKCSRCGDVGFLLEDWHGDWVGQACTDYCPSCGADMRGKIK